MSYPLQKVEDERLREMAESMGHPIQWYEEISAYRELINSREVLRGHDAKKERPKKRGYYLMAFGHGEMHVVEYYKRCWFKEDHQRVWPDYWYDLPLIPEGD
jgi:hypothetical protein